MLENFFRTHCTSILHLTFSDSSYEYLLKQSEIHTSSTTSDLNHCYGATIIEHQSKNPSQGSYTAHLLSSIKEVNFLTCMAVALPCLMMSQYLLLTSCMHVVVFHDFSFSEFYFQLMSITSSKEVYCYALATTQFFLSKCSGR